jgi:hypothetical protein
MKKITALALVSPIVGLLIPLAALAHGGGFDEYGCHHDNKVVDYHSHSAPLAGRSFPSQQVMLAQLPSSPGSGPFAPIPTPTPKSPSLAPTIPAPAPQTNLAPYVPDHTRTPGAINPNIT